MKPFAYVSAAHVDEVAGLLANGADGVRAVDGQSRVLAGGTDLLTLMKADVESPVRLVNIKRAAGITDQVAEAGGGAVEIGALTTLATIARHPLVTGRYPALARAAAAAASPQIRNVATIAGNLLQRPRCWYFRSHLFNCWLKGGPSCPAKDGESRHHALFGGGPCHAVHPSDPAPALIAYDAELTVRGPSGQRIFRVDELFALPTEQRRTETVLAAGEIVTSVRLPAVAPGTRGTYLKAMERKDFSFALVGVAAVVSVAGESVAAARLVLGGVAPIPWRVPAAEAAMVGSRLDGATAARAADIALEGAWPLKDNAYKAPLAKALITRALTEIAAPQE